MKKKELYIPMNAAENNDFITGFGHKEFALTGVSLAIALVLFVFLQTVFGKLLISFTIGIFIVGVTVIMVKRDKYNESFIDKMKFVLDFMNAQKKYEYFYHSEYESILNEEEGE